MFARVKRFKNKDGSVREYLFIVENKWVNGKVRQRTVANLGRLDNILEGDRIDKLIESIAKYAKRQQIIDACKDIDALFSKGYGPVVVFRKIWQKLKLDKLFYKYLSETEKEVDLVEAIFALVCNRLMAPSSKRGAHRWKEEVYEPLWDKYQLHHFYRALDFLQDNKERLEKEIFDNTRDIFNSKVDIVMFDTTTISFWGDSDKNSLAAYGYAKNKRFDLKQVVIGLIMDRDGVPLGHEVWPGNTSDKKAFKEVIDKIRKKFSVGKVILVCDRGMVSEEIISYLEENGYEYVLGIKMRSLSKIRKEILLRDEGFEKLSRNIYIKEMKEADVYREEQIRLKKGKEKDIKEYQESPKGKRRWVVYLNKLVEKEDQAKREYFQKIIERKIEFSTAKEWIIKNGYKKYVIIKDMEIELNRKRIEEDELYDGKWVLISNSALPAKNLVFSYKSLSQIERHFRDLKSELEIGPIYHYIERRIRAHVFVCFLALQIKVYLTRKLKEIDEELSYTEIIRKVEEIKAVRFRVKEKEIIMRTELPEGAHLAFKAAGCAIPPKILHTGEENLVPTSTR